MVENELINLSGINTKAPGIWRVLTITDTYIHLENRYSKSGCFTIIPKGAVEKDLLPYDSSVINLADVGFICNNLDWSVREKVKEFCGKTVRLINYVRKAVMLSDNTKMSDDEINSFIEWFVEQNSELFTIGQ